MAFEVKDMTGSLWPTKEKKNENSPDFTGNVKIQGATFKIGAWKNKTKAGKPYINMRIQEDQNEEKQETSVADPFGDF